MRKAGKPNIFFKGMKSDMDPAAQPKDSYRYAKNIRLTSFDGKNVAIHPYDSDKEVLALTGTFSQGMNTTTSISNQLASYTELFAEYNETLASYNMADILAWGDNTEGAFNYSTGYLTGEVSSMDWDTEEYVLNPWLPGGQGGYEMYNNSIVAMQDETWNTFIDSFMEAYFTDFALPLQLIVAGTGDLNSDGISFSFVVTLTMSDGTVYEIDADVGELASFLSDESNLHFENIIAQAISDSDNGIAAIVSESTLEPGKIIWNFTYDGDETVTAMTIMGSGDIGIAIIGVGDDFTENMMYAMNEMYNDTFDNDSLFPPIQDGQNMNALRIFLRDLINQWINVNANTGEDVAVEELTEDTPFWVTAPVPALTFDPLEIEAVSGENQMEILGYYEFSDYVVLLGHWKSASLALGYNCDFIIKTTQKENGELAQVGETGYQMFFNGNLGFTEGKKLKVVGSEENEATRRLYFTDGDMPLRTINVGAPTSLYANVMNNPGYFDLFVEANLSIPKVTGFTDGGSLDSIGHAYAFRYKTRDGRYSKISPVSNPASVPATPKSTSAAFTLGADADNNSGKTIRGVIENLDERYNFVEMIYVPYVGGVPGTAKVFNTLSVGAADIDGNLTVEWVHTGNEISNQEILIDEFSTDIVSWDTCKALEVKDNRLFCGNLKGTTTSIETDFLVASYNNNNQHHSYATGNPHLYHDGLYSKAWLDFGENGTNPGIYNPMNNNLGGYCNTVAGGLYRYIKNAGSDTSAFYSGYLSAPYYWTSWNSAPSDSTVNRGIFGAESRYFNEYLPSEQNSGIENEHEGVRVTFRVLGANQTAPSPAPAVQLDKDNKLITTGDFQGARAPFYKLDPDSGGNNYYANYANPLYNSNYVGYRRGEIYRFGILFYDKKGQPMFVKPIGDVRMPEHSTEYVVPDYGEDGNVAGIAIEWPFYYQTSRHHVDNGFADWPGKNWDLANSKKPYTDHPSDKGEGHYGCVLYPHFEVKLSSTTSRKISGYTIVRVERTPKHRTISTSGVLQRAVKYVDYDENQIWNYNGNESVDAEKWAGAHRVDMHGKFGNSYIPFWTPTIQGYRSHRYGSDVINYNDNTGDPTVAWSRSQLTTETGATDMIGGHPQWSHSNIYTIDSPDAILNSNFNLNFSGGDRLKITESRYCVKENVSNGGSSDLPFESFFNHYLSEGTYPGSTSDTQPADHTLADFDRPAYSVSLFASLIATDLLEGKTVPYKGEELEVGGWRHKFSNVFGSSTAWEGDWRTFDYQFRGLSVTSDSQSDSWLDSAGQSGNPAAYDMGSDWYNLGIHTKFYSKRIGSYPMYGMANADWNAHYFNSTSKVTGTGGGFSMNGYTIASGSEYYTPQFLGANAWGGEDASGVPDNCDFWYTNLGLHNDLTAHSFGVRATNILPSIIANGTRDDFAIYYGERVDGTMESGAAGAGEYWNESRIQFAKVVNSGEEVSMSDLGSDRDYRNATMWHDLHRQCARFSLNSMSGNINFQLGGNIGKNNDDNNERISTYCEDSADYSLNSRTIVLSLPFHGMLPVTRHCLAGFNWQERVFWQFGGSNHRKDGDTCNNVNYAEFGSYGSDAYGGTGGGSRWSEFSPEVTMASIVKKQTSQSMYGGYGAEAFSKNTFISTGHFQQVNTTGPFLATGENGNHVFGGDTYICNFGLKKTNDPAIERKWTPPGEPVTDYAERGVLTAYTCPVETETNLDLRHGLYFGGNNSDIPKLIEDDFGDYGYNTSYDSSNIIQAFLSRPTDFIEIDHWPSTIAFSEPKFPGSFYDSYSIFPFGQIKDLDYSKGPITQMFKVSNNLFTTQFSGTCQLQVNPRVMIPAGEGGAITTISGTDSVIERYDYISESLGSQHFHNLAVTDRGAYYYDDNASKFIKLARGKGGGWGVLSLGDSLGMQSHFNKFKNGKINDNPLRNYDFHRENTSLKNAGFVLNSNYSFVVETATSHPEFGGITLGYDPEYGEVLFTMFPTTHMPETIVYNENLDAFTSFVSKRPAQYINYKKRLYETYSNLEGDTVNSNRIYLSNGYSNKLYDFSIDLQGDVDDGVRKYLNFGGVDYYIFGDLTSFDGNAIVDIPYEDISGISGSSDIDVDLFGTEQSIFNQYLTNNPMPQGHKWTLQDYLVGGNYPEMFTLNNFIYYAREPIQIQFVINDEPNMPKIFDSINIDFKANSRIGSNHLYFRKFAFWGSSNLSATSEYDTTQYNNIYDENGAILDTRYSGAQTGFHLDPQKKMWYNVKDGTHHVPLRPTGQGLQVRNVVDAETGLDIYGVATSESEPVGMSEIVCRGYYAIVGMTMGWNEDDKFFNNEELSYPGTSSGNSSKIKDEGFSILSIIPSYRYSKR